MSWMTGMIIYCEQHLEQHVVRIAWQLASVGATIVVMLVGNYGKKRRIPHSMCEVGGQRFTGGRLSWWVSNDPRLGNAQCYLLSLFLKVSELHSALKVIESIGDNYVCSSHGLKKDFTVHPRDINRRRTGIQLGATVLPWFSLRTTLAYKVVGIQLSTLPYICPGRWKSILSSIRPFGVPVALQAYGRITFS